MGVLIKVYGNHTINFDTDVSVINKMEYFLGEQLRNNMRFSSLSDSINSIEFYWNKEKLKEYLQKYNHFTLLTNYKFCNEIVFYPGAIKFDPKGFKHRFHIWKNYQSPGFKLSENYNLLEKDFQAWLSFHDFCRNFLKKMKGNMLLVIDDHSFQVEEEMIYEGKSLKQFFETLCKISIPNNKIIRTDQDTLISVNDHFFYENIRV